MAPGDLIEWTRTIKKHKFNVPTNTFLWSSTMYRYVPIGPEFIHVLVSIDEERIVWLNEEGYFHARVDDTPSGSSARRVPEVLPRACG